MLPGVRASFRSLKVAKWPREMLHSYFDFWANFWRDAAEAVSQRNDVVDWIVQFGDVEKKVLDVHPDTGLPALIAPLRCWIDERLPADARRGLAIVFRIDPRLGVVHMLRGPASTVACAEKALSRSSLC
jgi:hypothetical protein